MFVPEQSRDLKSYRESLHCVLASFTEAQKARDFAVHSEALPKL